MWKIPSWSVVGLVTEARELKTKENRTWAHALKVVAMGGTYEMTTRDEKIVKGIGQGEVIEAVGTFEFYEGAPKLIVSAVKVVQKAEKAA